MTVAQFWQNLVQLLTSIQVEAAIAAVTLPKTWRKVLVLTFDAIFYETNLNGESQDCRKVCEYPRAWEEVPASGQRQPTGCNASAPPVLTAPRR
jgi:hypothetical protein